MLVWRITLGTGIIAALAAACWLDCRAQIPGIWLFPIALVLALLAAVEMAALAPLPRTRGQGWGICLGTLLVVTLSGVPIFWPHDPQTCPVGWMGWPAMGVAMVALIALVSELWRFREPGRGRDRLAFSVFAVVYVGLLLSFLVQVRILGDGPRGMVALVSLIATVKLGDVGAYTVGRLVGRHKMAPALSPGKTWEGAVGAVLLAWIGAWLTLGPLARSLGTDPLPAVDWLVYGVVLSAAGMLGDLAESLLKRAADVKDSSRWLPGFGGVLDMLDSLLVAAPVAYTFWCLRVAVS